MVFFAFWVVFPKNRTFYENLHGGLGIPQVLLFCNALFIKTAARAAKSTQPWANSLKKFFPQNDISLYANPPPPTNSSVLPHLVKALNNFHCAFYKKHFWSSPIFNCYIIKPLIDAYPMTPTPHLQPLVDCKISDFYNFHNKRTLSFTEIYQKFNFNPPYLFYFRIYGIILNYTQHNPPPSSPPPSKSLLFFYHQNPKAKIIYQFENNNHICLETLAPINYYHSIHLTPFNEMQSKLYLTLWRYKLLPNDFRNFILLFTNNKLILNYQLSKFMDASPYCTFCSFFPSSFYAYETPEHLFSN